MSITTESFPDSTSSGSYAEKSSKRSRRRQRKELNDFRQLPFTFNPVFDELLRLAYIDAVLTGASCPPPELINILFPLPLEYPQPHL